jgi:uncharacterized protein (DUF2141 family)
MQRPLTFLALAILWGGGIATATRADTLNVVLENIEAPEGAIMMQVMAGESEFAGDTPPVASFIQRAQNGEISFSTSGLPAGEYAVRVMHDRNGNGELDANFVGIPTEPWAFSNNATGNFGPPGWDKVKFTLEGTTTQRIKLQQ